MDWTRVAICRGLNASSLAPSLDGKTIALASEDGSVRLHDATSGGARKVLATSSSPALDCAWHPSSVFVASSHTDGYVQVFEPRSGLRLGRLAAGVGGVPGSEEEFEGTPAACSLSWSPCGRYLAVGREDGLVAVFDCSGDPPSARGLSAEAAWPRIALLEGHTDAVLAVRWDPAWARARSRLASGSADCTVRVWEEEKEEGGGEDEGEEEKGAKEWVCAGNVGGHAHAVQCLAWSPDGLRLVSGSADSSLRILDGVAGGGLGCLERVDGAHEGSEIVSCAFSPDGLHLATGADNGVVRVFKTAFWAVDRTIEGHRRRVRGLSFSPTGGRLWSASSEKLTGWELVESERGLSAPAAAAATATWEPMVQTSGFLVASCAAWSPDAARVAIASGDGELRVVDRVTWTERASVDLGGSAITHVAWTASFEGEDSGGMARGLGQSPKTAHGWIVAVTSDGRVWGVDGRRLSEGVVEEVGSLRGSAESIVAWPTPDGGVACAVAGAEKAIKVFTRSRGSGGIWACTATLDGHTASLTSIATSTTATPRALLSGSTDGAVLLWRDTIGPGGTWGCEATLRIPPPAGKRKSPKVAQVALSADGNVALAVSTNGHLVLWQRDDSGAMSDASHVTVRVAKAARSLALSKDGRFVAIGNTTRTILVLEIAALTRDPEAALRNAKKLEGGHSWSVVTLAFAYIPSAEVVAESGGGGEDRGGGEGAAGVGGVMSTTITSSASSSSTSSSSPSPVGVLLSGSRELSIWVLEGDEPRYAASRWAAGMSLLRAADDATLDEGRVARVQRARAEASARRDGIRAQIRRVRGDALVSEYRQAAEMGQRAAEAVARAKETSDAATAEATAAEVEVQKAQSEVDAAAREFAEAQAQALSAASVAAEHDAAAHLHRSVRATLREFASPEEQATLDSIDTELELTAVSRDEANPFLDASRAHGGSEPSEEEALPGGPPGLPPTKTKK